MIKMKKTSLLVSFVAGLAAVFSCTPQEATKNELTVYLSAQESFQDSKATISVVLSDTSSKNVVVNLEADESATDAIKASALKFDNAVTVDAGSNATAIMVELVNVPNGPATAYIKIVAANGAVAKTEPVAIKFTPQGYDNSDDPNNPGGEDNPGGDDNPGGPDAGDMTLVKDWSVSLLGDPYTYAGYPYQDVNVNLSGITYFWMEAYTDEELTKEYGTIENMANEWAEEFKSYIDDGDEMADIVFTLKDKDFYLIYPGEGKYNVYILEFNEDGSPSGRYGVCELTFAALEDDGNDVEISIPDSFIKNAKYSVEYIGRYQGLDEDEYGNEIEADLDVFSPVGTGEDYWVICVDDKGAISSNVKAYAAEVAKEIEEYFAEIYEEYGAYYEYLGIELSVVDILNYGEFTHPDGYGYSEYYAFDNGEYEAVVFLFDEDGNFTGEYGLNNVTIDGSAFEWPDYDDDDYYTYKTSKKAVKIHRPNNTRKMFSWRLTR